MFDVYNNRIPWHLLTGRERAALVSAGGPYEYAFGEYGGIQWYETHLKLTPIPDNCHTVFRKKRVPVIETVVLHGDSHVFGAVQSWPNAPYKITFNIVDGEVDVFSIKMERRK